MALTTRDKGCLVGIGLLFLLFLIFVGSQAADVLFHLKADTSVSDPRNDPGWRNTPAGKLGALHPDWSWEVCKTVASGHIEIGFTSEQCLAAWGAPASTNRTVTANNTHEQWCYGRSCKPALYFDNGVLTSYQD
jgi:hypothetical protein